ncbi:redox-active disulfide protein 2 [Flavobacterium sp. KACC 22761]|uniref:redox-active disulfide protein 2 n=1 Tax=Flavobacterium sp. KACC 22761 TaxID=3092665 RepID=UPI002A75EA1D|nr:redox-active disulfide protein 2 [Flavobacterium sp. KACC 22761]WPO80794.1 redox-active disulfide protein 2 [Flavobacterium sp. KACC 22761]
MKNNKFSEMSTEELIKNHKTLKTVNTIFAVVLIMLFALNIFIVCMKGFSAMNVVPIALLPILFLNANNLKEIKKELESRK